MATVLDLCRTIDGALHVEPFLSERCAHCLGLALDEQAHSGHAIRILLAILAADSPSTGVGREA